MQLQSIIESAYDEVGERPDIVWEPQVKLAIEETLKWLDSGHLRIAEPSEDDGWRVNSWAKKAILLYFRISEMKTMHSGEIEYWDKVPLKSDFSSAGVRVVPPGVARYGSYIEKGVVLMPSFVNIGAYIGASSMVDTWATVGSCAQIGKNVHISGGVGIGGVLEPPQADPVIIEDDVFLGSRCVVVEGVHVKKGAVLGSGVILTASTKIVDVTQAEERIYQGYVPQNSVVIPGMRAKNYPAGTFQIPVALIIGERKESTNKKTSLNAALRKFEVPV